MTPRKPPTIDKLFPSAHGCEAADRAVDALPVTVSLRDAMHTWEEAYWVATGHSPFRMETQKQ